MKHTRTVGHCLVVLMVLVAYAPDALAIRVVGRPAPSAPPTPAKPAVKAAPKAAAKPAEPTKPAKTVTVGKPPAEKPTKTAAKPAKPEKPSKTAKEAKAPLEKEQPPPVVAVPAPIEPTPVAATPEKEIKPTPPRLREGDQCEVQQALFVKLEPKKKGAKAQAVKLDKGTVLTVRTLAATARLSTPKGDATVKHLVLEANCYRIEDAPPPPPTVVALATPVSPWTPPVEPEPASAPASTPVEPEPDLPVISHPAPPPLVLVPAVVAKRDDGMSRAKKLRIAAWIGTVTGVVGVGVGATLVGLSYGNEGGLRRDVTNYNNNPVRLTSDFSKLEARRSDISTMRTAGVIVGAVGVAALTAGIILFIIGPSPSRPEASTAVGWIPMPTVTDREATMSWSGTF